MWSCSWGLIAALLLGLGLIAAANLGLLVLGKRESIRFTRVEPFYQELAPNLRIYRRMQ